MSRRLKNFQIWSRKWSGRQVEIACCSVQRKEFVRNVQYIAHVQTVCTVNARAECTEIFKMHVENFNSFVVFSFSHLSKIPRAIELLLTRCLFVETEKPQLHNSSGFVHVVWSFPVFHSLNRQLEILCLIDVNCHLFYPFFICLIF